MSCKSKGLRYAIPRTNAARESFPADHADEGLIFIEQYILPTLERREELQSDDKIIASGPVSGAVALDLIVNADSARGLDEVITSLPVWPLMEATITPPTMFNDHRQAVLAIRQRLATQVRGGPAVMLS
jgi:muconolactone delta-isomerase